MVLADPIGGEPNDGGLLDGVTSGHERCSIVYLPVHNCDDRSLALSDPLRTSRK